ncbi:carbon-nitrogen hydrolase family protein [Desulfovirgula thermocuniculi]|uniref:carbon-nitrogen hydrolase family protein n=1 Tax=Desulfovirgula thermocuniculi TaxID=348842 RepID=UPI0004225172|nr:carbon-nitrogen hydrolase family protein [Desulfovirgula thermocuniculi]
MQRLTLAIVQFPRGDNPEENVARMAHYLSRITPGTDLVLLPEDWLGPAVVDFEEYFKIVEGLATKVSSRRCLLVSGAQYVRCGGRILSRGIFWGGDLDAPVCFEKLFPSQAIGERDYIAPGTLLPVVEHRGVKVGAVVCVDLMYPEIARSLALEGAALILNPANIPATRMPLWHAVGTARACENTVFVAMANNTATSYADGREVMGESFLAPPDGYGFLSCGREPGVFYFKLDLARISRVRQRWPYLEDVANLTRPPIPVSSFPGKP